MFAHHPEMAGGHPGAGKRHRFPPVFSSPATTGWNGGRFGFDPGLRTPRLPATHAGAETGPSRTGPGTTPSTSVEPQRCLPLHSCTFTSHPSVGCFQHHLGVRASALKLQPQRNRIVDDPHRRELITGFRLAHDDRSLAMQIDPDELPNVILVHRGLL